MDKLRAAWRGMFDVREGELALTLLMAAYLLFVMFAYYVLKPVSRAMFLTEFKVDRLPLLNILIAAAGGIIAYVFSKFVVRASLAAAVTWTMGIAASCLVAFWWLTGLRLPGMLYVFNVWVSLFSAILVSQGWLVAANLFDSRSAKRLYGILGVGAVLGAAFGGMFTATMAKLVGSRNLLLAAVVLVGLAYTAFRLAITREGTALSAAQTGQPREKFTLRDIVTPIASSRHLQLIVGLFGLTLLVSTLVEFQFQASASAVYRGDQLTAFLGRFQGLYLTMVTVPLQFFLTAAVVRRLGLGGTLAVMPVCIAGSSAAMIAMPGLGPAMAGELADSATRYTLNRTAMELLYLPHPAEVRNRVKTFVDVFVDRMSRGIGGILLAALLSIGIRDRREIGALIFGICILWAFLCVLAQREYVRTLRDRVGRRRLDLESSRVNVSDPEMIAMLVETAEGPLAGPVCYALDMLAEAPDFNLRPLLRKLAASPIGQVRAKVYEVAWFVRFGELQAQSLAEIRRAAPGAAGPELPPAVEYALSFAADEAKLARELIGHPNETIAGAAVHILGLHPVTARDVLTPDWIVSALVDRAPQRRRLAALAIASVRGGDHTAWLHALLRDPDASVAGAACRAASVSGNRAFLPAVIPLLANASARRDAAEALTMYGAIGLDTLAATLDDNAVAVTLRRQIPRVLGRIVNQKSVHILLGFLGHPDLAIRGAVVEALVRLRRRAPDLDYGGDAIARQVLAEARYYCELHAMLAPLAENETRLKATGLLARTLEHRAALAVERLFRLLGLRYPQHDVHAAYRSLRGSRREEAVAALELLENMLEPPLRRVVVPLMDSPSLVVEKGRELFRIQVGTAESAIRELLHAGDTWLVACAVASAAERGLRGLAAELRAAEEKDPVEVGPVARSALAALGASSQPRP